MIFKEPHVGILYFGIKQTFLFQFLWCSFFISVQPKKIECYDCKVEKYTSSYGGYSCSYYENSFEEVKQILECSFIEKNRLSLVRKKLKIKKKFTIRTKKKKQVIKFSRGRNFVLTYVMKFNNSSVLFLEVDWLC